MSDAAEREKAIIDAARLLPAVQQAAFLNMAAGGDTALRKRLDESMAGAGDQPARDTQPASSNPTVFVAVSPTEKAGDWIGRYKLLQQIGEGGCGVVYMAEQEEPVRRRAALKVIKLGMDTKNVIARFEAERQALAMMDHPNIAKVLDAGGTDSGRPFFVMELVRGIKITEYCDQHSLSTKERLELFIRVCHAIQHAHQKGIIHRDIKPSNILVTLHDGEPVPKVIDFGIAKATQGRLTDETLFTAFEQFIGTPAYMSPEQAEMSGLDIDTRSDIYSLGVLLYELLTGKTPFDQKQLIASGLDQMRRTIREKEPERPSTKLGSMLDGELTTTAKLRRTEPPKLVHLVRGDLDWIVMKCLEKDRTRRYETASGLALDVQRYLSSQPILARPPSRSYQLQKFIRRHRTGAQVAAVLGVVIILLVVFLFHEYFRAERMTKAANANALAAQAAAAKANEDAELARRTQAAESKLNEQVEARLAAEAKMRANTDFTTKLGSAQLLISQGEYRKAEEMVNQMPSYPASAAIYNSLGLSHVGRAEWLAAIKNYTRVVELAPLDHVAYHCLPPLLAFTGDDERFNEHRGRILRQFGNSTDPKITETLAKDCLLFAPSTANLAAIETMLNKSIAARSSGPHREVFTLAKALLDFRAGRYSAAIDSLAPGKFHTELPFHAIDAAMIRAMAQFQSNHSAEAHATFAASMEFAKANLPKLVRGNLEQAWSEVMSTHVLIREAAALLGEANPLAADLPGLSSSSRTNYVSER